MFFVALIAAYSLWSLATISFVISAWADGGGGRSDAAVMLAFLVIGVPIWVRCLCAVGEDCGAT